MNPQDPFRSTPPTPPPTGGTSLPPVNPEGYPQPVPLSSAPAPNDAQANFNIDYLNAIAPNQQKMVNKFAVFGLIGCVIVAVIFAVLLMTAHGGSSADQLVPTIAGRISTLEAVTSDQQEHLSENQISESNATLNSTLDTMSSELKVIITDQKLTKKAASVTKKGKAYQTALTETFDNAYQRGTLDRTYATQMTYELTMLESQITSLSKSTKNKATLNFCTESLDSLKLLLQSFNSFTAAKE